jgi:hypothetical protein
MSENTSQAPGTFIASIKVDTSIDFPTEVHVF